jgi:hypothetical protein
MTLLTHSSSNLTEFSSNVLLDTLIPVVCKVLLVWGILLCVLLTQRIELFYKNAEILSTIVLVFSSFIIYSFIL